MYRNKTRTTDEIHGKIIAVCNYLRTRYSSKNHGGFNIYEDDKIIAATDTYVSNVDLYVKINNEKEYVFGCNYDGHQVTYHSGKWEDYLNNLYQCAMVVKKEKELDQAQKLEEERLKAESPASEDADSVFNEDNMVSSNINMNINVQCVHCGNDYVIGVNKDDYLEWKEGHGFIQDKLSYLTKGERELIISGTCDSCWDNMFGSSDDDDEEDDDE